MTRSIWTHPPSDPRHDDADAWVLGAGITGLSLAHWLKEFRPAWRVLVVDRGTDVAAGASGRNAGFHTAGSVALFAQLAAKEGAGHARRFWEFKQESLRLMREQLFSRYPTSEFALLGSTTLYRDADQMARERELVAGLGAEPESVSTEALGTQGLEGFVGGLRLPVEGACHPMRLLGAWRASLEERGVVFRLGESAGWIESSSGGARLTLERGSARAPLAFLALNGYLPQFLPELAGWVKATRAQMLSLHVAGARLCGNFYDPAHKVYFRLDGEQLLVGGMRLLEEASEVGEWDKTTPTIQAALEAYARGIYGDAPQVTARWSGVMGFTPNEIPWAKPLPGIPGAFFVGGYSGHGMGAAFGTARAAVRRALGLSAEGVQVLSC